MFDKLTAYLKAQDADEIARQYALLVRGQSLRLPLEAVGYVMATAFLPVSTCLWIGVCKLIVEIGAQRSMRQLDPARQFSSYLMTFVWVALAEFFYSLLLALIWQEPDTYAKAFSMALLSLALVQLTTMRIIHMPFGVTNWLVGLGTCLIGNAMLWLRLNDLTGFVFSTTCILAGAALVWSVMQSNHALHVGLVQERVAAQTADQAKGRFLAQVSHELRTPLNAIMGMGEAELTMSKLPDTKARMEVLIEATKGLTVILDDILDMSAIAQGKLTLRPLPANPLVEIAATIALFRLSFAQAGLTLTLQSNPGLPELALFDAQRLRQCLTNLLSNALKFTSEGGVQVWAAPRPEGGLQVEVADSGIGLGRADCERLFEPFMRGSAVHAGNGLGLPISRALARAMGGDLVALPAPRGALFRLTIVLESVDQPLAAIAPKALPDLAARRILVVDDIATNRLVAATFLRILGAQVIEAISGEAALDMIRADCPDLVLLDMNMPGLSGPETVALMRQLPGKASRLPVLAMTADATAAHRTQYLVAGVDGYLSKPLTLDALRAALGDHLPQSA